MSSCSTSTCATHGSVKSSNSASKTCKSKAKMKSNSWSVGAPSSKKSSSTQASNTNSHGSLVVSSSHHHHSPENKHSILLSNVGRPDGSSALSSIVTATCRRTSLDHKHCLLQCLHYGPLTSTTCAVHQDTSLDSDYSIARFVAENSSTLFGNAHAPAKDLIRDHTISVKAYLSAWDTLFDKK